LSVCDIWQVIFKPYIWPDIRYPAGYKISCQIFDIQLDIWYLVGYSQFGFQICSVSGWPAGYPAKSVSGASLLFLMYIFYCFRMGLLCQFHRCSRIILYNLNSIDKLDWLNDKLWLDSDHAVEAMTMQYLSYSTKQLKIQVPHLFHQMLPAVPSSAMAPLGQRLKSLGLVL
jgi:hypothetical protein